MNLNKSGHSLVEVLVVAGITVIIGFVIMQMTSTSNKAVKTAQTAYEAQDIVTEIKSLISISDNCTKTFGTGSIKVGDKNISVSLQEKQSDGTFAAKFAPDVWAYGIGKSIKILSYNIVEGATGTEDSDFTTASNKAMLYVNFQRQATSFSEHFQRKFPLWVKVDSSKVIQECRALFNDDQIWKRSKNDQANIFYDTVGGTSSSTSGGIQGVVTMGDSTDLAIYNGVTVHARRKDTSSILGISTLQTGITGIGMCSHLPAPTTSTAVDFFGTCQVPSWQVSSDSTSLNISSGGNGSVWMNFDSGSSNITVPGRAFVVKGGVDGLSTSALYTRLDGGGIAISKQGLFTSGALANGANAGTLINDNLIGIGSVDTTSGKSTGYTIMTPEGLAVADNGSAALGAAGLGSGSNTGAIMNKGGFAVGSASLNGSDVVSGGYSWLAKDGLIVTKEGTPGSGATGFGVGKVNGAVVSIDVIGVGGVNTTPGIGNSQGYALMSPAGVIVTTDGSAASSPSGFAPGTTTGAIMNAQGFAVGSTAGDYVWMQNNKMDLHVGNVTNSIDSTGINYVGAVTIKSPVSISLSGSNVTIDKDLTVAQDITAHQVTATSDYRLKRNITNINNPLEKILNLNGVYFYWVDPKKNQDRQMGLIAQNVRDIFPEAVKENKEGLLSVNYMGLIGPIVEAVKELYSKLVLVMDKLDSLIESIQKLTLQQDEIKIELQSHKVLLQQQQSLILEQQKLIEEFKQIQKSRIK